MVPHLNGVEVCGPLGVALLAGGLPPQGPVGAVRVAVEEWLGGGGLLAWGSAGEAACVSSCCLGNCVQTSELYNA